MIIVHHENLQVGQIVAQLWIYASNAVICTEYCLEPEQEWKVVEHAQIVVCEVQGIVLVLCEREVLDAGYFVVPEVDFTVVDWRQERGCCLDQIIVHVAHFTIIITIGKWLGLILQLLLLILIAHFTIIIR